MSKELISIGTSKAFKITQPTGSFYVVPLLTKMATEILGLDSLKWNEKDSSFSGINRTIKPQHKARILAAINNNTIILPNSIIAYIKHEYFKFQEIKSFKTDAATVGEVSFWKSASEDSPPSIILDGQHRFSALKERGSEKGEFEFPFYVVFFHQPDDSAERTKFDDLCLDVMTQVNRNVELSATELGIISIKKGKLLDKNEPKDFLAIVVKNMNDKAACPVKFSYGKGKKHSVKGMQFLQLSVWVNAIKSLFLVKHFPRPLFQIWEEAKNSPVSIRKDSWQVTRFEEMVTLAFQAIYGLLPEFWERRTSTQRLYHNIGIRAVLAGFDVISREESLFSEEGSRQYARLCPDTNTAIRRIQKRFFPLKLLNWKAIKGDSSSMMDIKQQQDIDKHFMHKVIELIKNYKIKYDEWEKGSNSDDFSFHFKIVSSSSQCVCDQSITISKKQWVGYSKNIDDDYYIKTYVTHVATPKARKARKKKNKRA